jgi:hypothetical protein
MKDFGETWYLVAGTFMAVSVASGVAFIVAFNSHPLLTFACDKLGQ